MPVRCTIPCDAKVGKAIFCPVDLTDEAPDIDLPGGCPREDEFMAIVSNLLKGESVTLPSPRNPVDTETTPRIMDSAGYVDDDIATVRKVTKKPPFWRR